MRTTEFLDNLRAKNIVVFVENGKVKVDAPEQVFTDDFLLELKARKTEILECLTNAEKPTDWFDLCACCKSLLYESNGQWFCPTNCR